MEVELIILYSTLGRGLSSMQSRISDHLSLFGLSWISYLTWVWFHKRILVKKIWWILYFVYTWLFASKFFLMLVNKRNVYCCRSLNNAISKNVLRKRSESKYSFHTSNCTAKLMRREFSTMTFLSLGLSAERFITLAVSGVG